MAPKGHSTRPTSDRARQALFDVLEHAPWSEGPSGARVLDLFAGSGALGIEALSRGAVHALFVDKDAGARAVIEDNLRALDLEDRADISSADATRLAGRRSGSPFTLAFLDPPYREGLAAPALEGFRAGGWLTDDALVVVEIAASETLAPPSGYEHLDERVWGAAKVMFLRHHRPG